MMNLTEDRPRAAGPPIEEARGPLMYSHAHPGRAPWYLTDGRSVVGPIDTHLLLRGITHARIPVDCMIAHQSAHDWRPLGEIRELSLLQRSPRWGTEAAVWGGIPQSWLRDAPNAGEALFFAMHAAVMATGAVAALVHRWREPFIGLVTSSVHGVGSDEDLGQVIPHDDPALAAARRHTSVIGTPADGEAERAIARRFAGRDRTVAGVAMIPVHDGDTLLAMLELARADHPFRQDDVRVLCTIAELVSLR